MKDFMRDELILLRDELLDLCKNQIMYNAINNLFKTKYKLGLIEEWNAT